MYAKKIQQSLIAFAEIDKQLAREATIQKFDAATNGLQHLVKR